MVSMVVGRFASAEQGSASYEGSKIAVNWRNAKCRTLMLKCDSRHDFIGAGRISTAGFPEQKHCYEEMASFAKIRRVAIDSDQRCSVLLGQLCTKGRCGADQF